VLAGSEVPDLSLNCPSYHELLSWLSWTSLNPHDLSLDCVKMLQPFFVVVAVCVRLRGASFLLDSNVTRCHCSSSPCLLDFSLLFPTVGTFTLCCLCLLVSSFQWVSLLVVPVVGTFFGLKGLIVIVYYSSVLGSN
jgi:hypothetical protein